MSEELKMKSEKGKFRNFRGITLISLVITIVILIILASVAIYLSLGNNGIFNRAKEAKELTNKQTATEKINFKITTAQMNRYAEKQEMPTLKELSEVLRDDNEIQYVTEKSQIASTKYEVGENPTSIYTKLNEYPYEFEIDSSLRLASISGVKIAKNENNNIDYSDSKNEVILTKKVNVNDNSWLNDIEGPEVEAGTWLIWLTIAATDTSHHSTDIGGTGCATVEVYNAYAGINSTSGYYKGEKTKLIGRIYNGSSISREYEFRFKALKLSDTY